MDDLAIIDRFTETFSRYIDSGFGLVAGDVAFLTSVLVAIDITLAGLFWALMGEDNVAAQLIKKVLYVGFFALLLNNFKGLADIIFQSFAGLGLKASGASLTAADLMRPGFVASTGFTASKPLLEKAGELVGITSFFTNFVTIVVLMLAWLIVLLAFFVLSVQLFITIIEFKLTVLAGFVLVPFALFGHTAFLAERVLGNVISAGIKLMVLAIVVGIGATLFGTLIRPTGEITLTQAASTPGCDRRVRLGRVRAGYRGWSDLWRASAWGWRSRGHHGGARRDGRRRRHARDRCRAPHWQRRGREHQSGRRADRQGRCRLRGGRFARRGTNDRDGAGVAHGCIEHGTGTGRLPARRCPRIPRCRPITRCRRSRPRCRSGERRGNAARAVLGAEPGAPAASDPGRDGCRRGSARGRPPGGWRWSGSQGQELRETHI
jgi:P-type conjugative transfer protein TrbL